MISSPSPSPSRLAVAALAAIALPAFALASAAPPGDAAATPPAHQKVAGLSAAEQAFVDKLLDALNARNADAAFALVSMKGVADRAAKDLSAYPEEMPMVKEGIAQYKAPALFSSLYRTRAGENADVAFSAVRGETVNGERHIVIRGRQTVLEYVTVVVVPDGADAVRCVDVRSPYASGWLSEMLHFYYTVALQLAHNGAVETGKIVDMCKGFANDDYKQVVADYESLPDASKQSRWVQRYRVMAATWLDAPEEIRATEDAKKRFPDDPGWDQILENAYLQEKRWPELLNSMDAVNATYKDPQAAEVRALVCVQTGDPKLIADALAKNPGNRALLEGYLHASIESEDWDGVIKAVALTEKATGESMYDDVRKDEQYKPFRRSDKGKAWLAAKRKEQAGKK